MKRVTVRFAKEYETTVVLSDEGAEDFVEIEIEEYDQVLDYVLKEINLKHDVWIPTDGITILEAEYADNGK